LATIQKIHRSKGVVYRVLIRKKGFKSITKVFSSKRMAVQFANRVESSNEALLAFGGENKTKLSLGDVSAEYLAREYKGKDYKKQSNKLDFWVKSIEIKPISDITTRDVSEAMLKLPKSLANATVNRYRSALSVVFRYACRQYNLPSNPVGLIPSKPEDNHRVRYLSTLERKRLLKACMEADWPKLYLLVLMAITTGARRGELLGLGWRDIDFERRTAFVQTTKNGQPKVLPLTSDVVNELIKFRQQGVPLIFNSEIKPNKAFCFNKQWVKALKVAEVEDFTFHCLRHTCASYLAQSGASLLEIADVLGHKQISVTKRYSHLCINHKEKLINSVMSNI
jgi:integrase